MADLWRGILDSSSLLVASKNSGCIGCPLEKQKPKLMGWEEVRGRLIMIWGQSPGREEVERGAAFVGRSGRWLWKELAKVGITRDQCDVQNVMRCRPVSLNEYGRDYDRDPSPAELRHCAPYNVVALRKNGGKAVLHLVFGKVAARQLLGREYDVDRPFLWSESLSAWVATLDHPSYFLRGAPKWRLEQFRARLKGAVRKLKLPGRWDDVQRADVRWAEEKSLRALMQQARDTGERVAVDIEDETTEEGRRILLIGFSIDGKRALVAPIDHPACSRNEKLISLIREALEDGRIRKTFHFGAYDCDSLRRVLGVEVRGYDFDTQHAHYLYQPHRRAHGLEVVASQEYPEFAGWKELAKSEYQQLSLVPLETLARYNGIDCILTKRIEMDLRGRINEALARVYAYAGRTLHRMEQTGPYLDQRSLRQLRPLIQLRLEEAVRKLRSIADDPNFNPASSQAIASLVYDRLGYPVDGKRTTDSDTLSILRQRRNHPAIDLILRYRELSKIESTYLRNYEESAKMNGGQIRTRWYLTGAVTGRLRSGGDGQRGRINMQNLHGSPHLQNLLVSDVDWRDALDEGKDSGELGDVRVFLALDYSQIEIRMLAECSGDELLIRQFREGMDIHCAVGHALDPKLSHEQIRKDKNLRTFIKACHFGMVYGLSSDGLHYYLQAQGIPAKLEDVKRFVDRYFKTYRGVKQFIDDMRQFASERGYVTTIFGFRRYIGDEYDEDRTTNPMNQAVNSPIQGAAHTLLLQALALLEMKPSRYKVLGTPIMEVHDAIVFSVRLADLLRAYRVAKKLLEQDVPAELERGFRRAIRVPLASEATAGFRYGTQVGVNEETTVESFLERWRAKHAELEKQYRESYIVS